MTYTDRQLLGFTRLCFRDGEALELPLSEFDAVSTKVEQGGGWHRCETIQGLDCLVDLSGVDCVIAMTAEEVARQNAVVE